jgi:PAS domain S-box-containing protein
MVWVGFAENDAQKSVRRAAAAGLEDDYLENARISWDERTPNGQGPTGMAIRTGQNSICQDIRSDPKMVPWRAAAAKRGYAASITLPLISGAETFGVLTLYSAQPHSFSHAEIQLLSELADDLVYGLQSLRTRAGRRRSEALLRESEEQFRAIAEGLPQLVWMCRPDGGFVYFNQRWVNYTGLTLDESYGDGWNKPFHAEDRQRAWEAWQRAVQFKEPYSLECRLRRFDGTYRWWLIRARPFHDANGEVLEWFGTFTDIEDLKHAEMVQAHAHSAAMNKTWRDS